MSGPWAHPSRGELLHASRGHTCKACTVAPCSRRCRRGCTKRQAKGCARMGATPLGAQVRQPSAAGKTAASLALQVPDLWTLVCAAPAGASPSDGAAHWPAPPGGQPPGSPHLHHQTLPHHAVAAGPVTAQSGQVERSFTLRTHHGKHYRQGDLQTADASAT